MRPSKLAGPARVAYCRQQMLTSAKYAGVDRQRLGRVLTAAGVVGAGVAIGTALDKLVLARMVANPRIRAALTAAIPVVSAGGAAAALTAGDRGRAWIAGGKK